MSLTAKVRGWLDDTHDPAADIDDVIHIFSAARRRHVIRTLQDTGHVDTITLRELVDIIATQKYGTGYTSVERKREYVTLYQTHLPTLDDHDIIEFTDTNEISRGTEFRAYADGLDELSRFCGGVE